MNQNYIGGRRPGRKPKPADVGHIGGRIRELRQARGLTIQELADRVGMVANSLNIAELRGQVPRQPHLDALAIELGTTAEALLDGLGCVQWERCHSRRRSGEVNQPLEAVLRISMAEVRQLIGETAQQPNAEQITASWRIVLHTGEITIDVRVE